jgi:subtilisin family serine protease
MKTIFTVLFMVFLFAVSCYGQDYIVSLKDSDAKEVMEEITSSSAISLMTADETIGEVISDKLNLILVSEEKAKMLMSEGKANYIEPDYESFLLEENYNDTYFQYQSYFKTNSIESLKAVSNGGKGIRVGIIDSGIYTQHEDFQGADIEEGYNFVTNTTDTVDVDNHGTSVAGIIAAQENNGKGIVGIAPDATLIPIVVNYKGTGTVSHIVKGIMAAADDYNCKIINLSVGTRGDHLNSMSDAVEYALEKGIIVVAAAGNNGNSTLIYPACLNGVIGVGAVDSEGNVASYSQRNTSVDVTAQGSSMYIPVYTGGYSIRQGTSFSAPVVTGMLTLLLGIDNTIEWEQMNEYIKKASVDMGDAGYDTSYGYGLLKGDELYRAYIDNSIIYVVKYENTYKFYSREVGEFYVFYSVFNKDTYKYGEWRKLSTTDNVVSDTFEYELSEGDEIKVTLFESFDTLKIYTVY